jgi:NTE family protein
MIFMKHFFLIFFLLIFFTTTAQKVSLVLSGGGAKGLAHVGVLKALEENDIPLDDVVGTSMGGIIGGCYAAGLSPAQIEEIVLSEDFLRWINGLSERGYNYYYHLSDDNSHFIKFNLALDSTLSLQMNTTLASDVSLNFALAEKMAQASAISKNNFDSLFVPFRVVTSDIFTQNQVILSKGHLNDALRATQTVPFFYTPIRVEGKYLFDGGIYNNFPVDVAQKEFHPDVIIGVNVSSKIYAEYPFDKDDKLISNSLLYMLLDKSDPGEIPENGIYIQPNLTAYTSLDFGKVKSMIDSGYAQTIRQVEEIKAKISGRVSCDEMAAKRNQFHNKNYPLIFGGVSYKGYNSKQRKYINRIFHYNPQRPCNLTFQDVKRSYFRLVSEHYFGNAYPNIVFDSTKRNFNFQLTRRAQKNFQVDFGGVIATRDISNIFLGLNYFHFGSTLLHAYVGFNTGNFYRSAVSKLRIDLPFQFYIEPELVINEWNYLANNDFLQQISPTVLKRFDRKYGLKIGWPISNSFRGYVGIDGLFNTDHYGNNEYFVSTDTLDQLRVNGYKGSFNLSTNNLNRKQYASEGKAYSLTLNYFNTVERYTPGNTSLIDGYHKDNHQWFRLKFTAEQYFRTGWFSTGYLAEIVVSNQQPFANYFGTIINAPAFLPLQDSRTLLLQNFRAFNYFAGGIRNVFSINKRIDIRLEGYLFKPAEYLMQGSHQEVVKTSNLDKLFFVSTVGAVLHSPIGPVSLSVNYYDDKENQFGVLLHVGYLLFNKHNIDQ